MTSYTVLIEASDEDQTSWQALAPAENVQEDGSACEVAEMTALDQNIAVGSWWRVRIWEGANADTGTEPAAEWCAEAHPHLLRPETS
jgi:hypothetical protein